MRRAGSRTVLHMYFKAELIIAYSMRLTVKSSFFLTYFIHNWLGTMETKCQSLGIASATLQMVALASDSVHLLQRIYDSEAPALNELEAHMRGVAYTVDLTESRYQAISGGKVSDDENKLREIAENGINVAREVEDEIGFLTGFYVDGRFLQTAKSMLEILGHPGKFDRLELTLSKYGEMMERDIIPSFW